MTHRNSDLCVHICRWVSVFAGLTWSVGVCGCLYPYYLCASSVLASLCLVQKLLLDSDVTV